MLWNGYHDAEETGRLAADIGVAESLQDGFREQGVSLDLVYATLKEAPNDNELVLTDSVRESRSRWIEWFASLRMELPAPPSDFVTVGMDVASPIPNFHSVLINPGLTISHDEELASQLNEHGLLTDETIATELMTTANRTGYLESTFCVVGVLARL